MPLGLSALAAKLTHLDDAGVDFLEEAEGGMARDKEGGFEGADVEARNGFEESRATTAADDRPRVFDADSVAFELTPVAVTGGGDDWCKCEIETSASDLCSWRAPSESE